MAKAFNNYPVDIEPQVKRGNYDKRYGMHFLIVWIESTASSFRSFEIKVSCKRQITSELKLSWKVTSMQIQKQSLEVVFNSEAVSSTTFFLKSEIENFSNLFKLRIKGVHSFSKDAR